MDKIGSILIGLAYLVLVVFLILFCARETDSFDGFSQYWGIFGTLVGVTTGAIPAFFFKTKAEAAETRAAEAGVRERREAQKAQLYAAAAGPDAAERVFQTNQRLFQ